MASAAREADEISDRLMAELNETKAAYAQEKNALMVEHRKELKDVMENAAKEMADAAATMEALEQKRKDALNASASEFATSSWRWKPLWRRPKRRPRTP